MRQGAANQTHNHVFRELQNCYHQSPEVPGYCDVWLESTFLPLYGAKIRID